MAEIVAGMSIIISISAIYYAWKASIQLETFVTWFNENVTVVNREEETEEDE